MQSSKPPTGAARVLVVDDDEDQCTLFRESLHRQGSEVVSKTSGREALEEAQRQDFDAIVTDFAMPGMNGIELCQSLVSARPDVPVIVVTGHGTLEAAIGAIRAGAYDFITKPVDGKLLALTVGRAVQHRRLRAEVRLLREALSASRRLDDIVGGSTAMKKLFDLVRRVAESDATVLITGESGTGKELVARALHEHGPRSGKPFLAVNCAAMPAQLLESELFGHVRGAFTDAKDSRKGLLVEADGGTLLLDEIGDLPLEVQPKLLRVLQQRTVRPVGGNQEIPFDVRIVAATNRDLETDVDEKRFREDLYYRINVVRLAVPPLRERRNDILLLAQHFLERFAARANRSIVGISTSAAEKMLAYEWPGNVRELENCMERAVALTRFDKITVEDLPEKIREYRQDRLVVSVEDPSELVTVEELERRYILRVLAIVGGNKSRAAEILGLDRRTLYRKLQKTGTDDREIEKVEAEEVETEKVETGD